MSRHRKGQCARLSLILSAAITSNVQRHCPRCKQARSFATSGKFRVNAQKKLIDIWLIYRCAICDQTWNHTIHERKAVRALPPTELDDFMRNDADLARHHAGLLAPRSGAQVAADNFHVERRIVLPVEKTTERLQIDITAPRGIWLRLDRVLAMGLKLRRSEIVELAEEGVLVVTQAGVKALRRPALDGQQIDIDLRRCSAKVWEICRELTQQ